MLSIQRRHEGMIIEFILIVTLSQFSSSSKKILLPVRDILIYFINTTRSFSCEREKNKRHLFFSIQCLVSYVKLSFSSNKPDEQWTFLQNGSRQHLKDMFLHSDHPSANHRHCR
jgi:hypothetical protein